MIMLLSAEKCLSVTVLFFLLSVRAALQGENTIFVSNLLKTKASPSDIKNLTSITYLGEFYGYAGHYTVPAQHNSDFENHIYTWFQPCGDCEDETKAPLLLWLQGGPGGPGWFGAFAELGNWYIGGNTSDAEPHKRCFSWCAKNNCLPFLFLPSDYETEMRDLNKDSLFTLQCYCYSKVVNLKILCKK